VFSAHNAGEMLLGFKEVRTILAYFDGKSPVWGGNDRKYQAIRVFHE
jgi:hypothetical protein